MMFPSLSNRFTTQPLTRSLLRGFATAALLSPLLAPQTSLADTTKLGSELTPLGAEPQASGLIPAWGQGCSKDCDTPLFTITTDNLDQYRDKLSPGLQALFARYPTTFRMPVYPTSRDKHYDDIFVARSHWNAANTSLSDNIEGLENFTGATPFPIPTSGPQVIWNARLSYSQPLLDGKYDAITTYRDGKQAQKRTHTIIESPYSDPDREVGWVDPSKEPVAGRVFVEILLPVQEKGELTVVLEPLNQLEHERKAWKYLPGARRVRRAPTLNYDTPTGPGGLITIDDLGGFNGAMDRYNWKLLGKQELFVPFANHAFDNDQLDYKTLLPPGHANPDYMRYQLRRVWVVEATVKPGIRHIYNKRHFYIEEDSWRMVLTDSYDSHQTLWRTAILNSHYEPSVKGYVNRANMFHDLYKEAYVTTGLINATRPTNYFPKLRGKSFFTAKTLRKMARR